MVWERLWWLLYRQPTFRRRYDGSWAHVTAYASPDSEFEGKNYVYSFATVVGSSLGRRSYLAPGAAVGNATIGRYCSIGPGARVGGHGIHPTSTLSTHPAFYSLKGQAGPPLTRTQRFAEAAATAVGNDVWIGARAMVVDGVSIGDGAIVGAGAVVVKPVPAYAIVGGVPARLIRMRFSEDVVLALQAFRWWEYSEETLAALADDFTMDAGWDAAAVDALRSRAESLEG